MNIASVKFKGIESNIYTRTKKQIQSNLNINRKDTIEISDLGKYLNKINSSDDMDRIEKINDIKRRIENNTYRIDSNELAKKIIEKTKGEI
ncbi:MAG: flagellar biosynthesis anti-sigma factor FlgM [Clostridium sp.]|nr:flagellar biosynthesis anti-sigma factor FlgM [Clostridium sp.]